MLVQGCLTLIALVMVIGLALYGLYQLIVNMID